MRPCQSLLTCIVHAQIPNIVAALSEIEFQLVVSCATDNFAEEIRKPPQWPPYSVLKPTASLGPQTASSPMHRRTPSSPSQQGAGFLTPRAQSRPPSLSLSFTNLRKTVDQGTGLDKKARLEVTVNIQQARLHLFSGNSREAALATLKVSR